MTNLQQILQVGQQVQARLTQLQTELRNRTFTVSSGGGMVTVTVDGRGLIHEVRIDPTVVDPNDVELLEDLVLAAVSEGAQSGQEDYDSVVRKMTRCSQLAV